MNYRLLSRYLGYFAGAIGLFFLPSLGLALLYGESEALRGLVLSVLCCGVFAGGMIAVGRSAADTMFQREALALVGVSWIFAAALGALPYLFSGLLGPVDAYFESMSGITTTGATVIVDIEATPKSILFWRSLSQWLGGMGIVVLFIAVLPYLGAGGKQLFKMEAPGPDTRGLQPRIRDTATFLYKVYLSLTVIQVIALMIAGMSLYDALCHTFSTMSTGGFSTRQASVGAYDSVAIEMIIVFFMIVAGGNFALYFAMLRGQWSAPFRDSEWRVYVLVFVISAVLVAVNLAGALRGSSELTDTLQEDGFLTPRYAETESVVETPSHALRVGIFQAVSLMTSTGFTTADFDAWPYFSKMVLLMIMFMGACGGSTAGGFKVIRVIMLLKMAYWRLETSFRPKTIRALRISGAVVEDEIQRRVSGFFILYLFWFLLGSLFMAALGMPFESATTAVVATLNNVGPGFQLVGPTMDYHHLPGIGKLFLSFCMVLGRLEIFTICVLLVPSFWHSRWNH